TQPEGRVRCRRRPGRGGRDVRPHQASGGQRHAGGPPRERGPGEANRTPWAPHNAIPCGAGVYTTPPPIDRVIHSLEHGAAIVWYAPSASGEELDRLRTLYEGDDVGRRG